MKTNYFSIDKTFCMNEKIVYAKNFPSNYLRATASSIDSTFFDKIAPISATAIMLAELLKRITIPPGLIHTGQKIRPFSLIYPEIEYQLRVNVTRSASRNNMKFLSFEMQLYKSNNFLLEAITSVTAPMDN